MSDCLTKVLMSVGVEQGEAQHQRRFQWVPLTLTHPTTSPWKPRLNQFFFHPKTLNGKAIERVLLICILASIIVILLDRIPALFTLEYALCLLLAADRPITQYPSLL